MPWGKEPYVMKKVDKVVLHLVVARLRQPIRIFRAEILVKSFIQLCLSRETARGNDISLTQIPTGTHTKKTATKIHRYTLAA